MQCSYAVAVVFDLVTEQDASLMSSFGTGLKLLWLILASLFFFTEFLVHFCNLELNLVMTRVHVVGLVVLGSIS